MKIGGIKERGVVLSLVKKYARRYKNIQLDELLAIAVESAFRAEKNWKPDRGTKRLTYVYKAVNLDLYKSITKQQAPVYGSNHCIKQLQATRNLSLYDADTNSEGSAVVEQIRDIFTSKSSLEELVDRARMYQKIHDHILAQPAGRAALAVILEGKTVNDAAKSSGVSPKTVRQATKAARQAIRSDQVLADYASDLT